MNIRDIEKIIDTFHEKHPAFTGTKQQMTYDLLATFEDLCSLAIIGSMLNPFSLKKNNGLYGCFKSSLKLGA